MAVHECDPGEEIKSCYWQVVKSSIFFIPELLLILQSVVTDPQPQCSLLFQRAGKREAFFHWGNSPRGRRSIRAHPKNNGSLLLTLEGQGLEAKVQGFLCTGQILTVCAQPTDFLLVSNFVLISRQLVSQLVAIISSAAVEYMITEEGNEATGEMQLGAWGSWTGRLQWCLNGCLKPDLLLHSLEAKDN